MTWALAVGVVNQNTVVFASVLAAAGVALLIAGFVGLIPPLSATTTNGGSTSASSVRIIAAGAGFFAGYLLSGWPVLAVFCAAAGWFTPKLHNAKRERKEAIDRVDAIATWVETVRDNISGAAGLSQALRNSGNTTPEPIRVEVRDLVLRLQHEPLVPALRRFAADLAHPTGDMAIGCLILAATRSAGSLSDILANTAQSARDSATMMRHVEAGRVQMQSQAKMVAAIAILMSVLMMLADGNFLEAYNGVVGQFVLFVICCMATACALTLYHLGKPTEIKRVFKGVEVDPNQAPGLINATVEV